MSDVNTARTSAGFQSRSGFILACIGSAVGLGNIWMFPYRLGEYGGCAFLIPYIIFLALFSYVGLSAEFAIGRRVGTGTLGSYEYCWNKIQKGRLGYLLGWIPLMGSLTLAIGYAIIVGWVVWAFFYSLNGALLTGNIEEKFQLVTSPFSSIPFHFSMIFIVAMVLIFGITRGIEKINKFLMPAFFLLFLVLAVWVFFLPNTMQGYKFMFTPVWGDLLKIDTWLMAMGQAFFSLSITGSGMIVYGRYLDKKEDIPSASLWTGLFDTLAAMLAALAIIPAVFSFGIAPDAGPKLMFITLPHIFQQLPLGRIFAVLFFLSVIFAGLTSLINMFEAVVESLENRFRVKRTHAILFCTMLSFLVGLFIEGANDVGSWMDFVTIIIVPFGAVLGGVSIYYILGFQEIETELNLGRKNPLPKVYALVAKYIYVPLSMLIFILGIILGGL